MSDIYSVGSTTSTSSTTNSTSTASQSTSTVNSSTDSTSKDLLRITGMASGLDVDSIVKKLMIPYQQKIDAVKQDQQKILWKQQMYQKIITDVKNLQNKYFNVVDPTNNVLSSSFYNTTAVDNSNTTAMKVTAGTDAINGTYTVKVNNVATGASIKGNTLNSMVSINLSDLSDWQGDTTSKSISFQVNGSNVNLSWNTNLGNDIGSIVTNLNKVIGDSDLNGKISVSSVVDGDGVTYLKFNNLVSSNNIQVTDSSVTDMKPGGSLAISNVLSVNSSTTLSQLGLTQAPQSPALTINYSGSQKPVTIDVTTGETLGQLSTAISDATGGAVYGVIDDITGKFTIRTKATGTTTTLDVASSNSMLTALGMNTLSSLSAQGTDASISITPPQGQEETVSETSNNFTLNGLTFNLMNTTSAGDPATVTVSQDADSVFTKFKGFMDQYNSVITEINTKLTEKITFDYPPLTDSQKSSMSQSDIDAWNTKAQQGLLHNDSNLSNLADELKNTFYQVVKGVNYTFGSKLGLDLSSEYANDGTLVFSDSTGDTFKQVLKDNPEVITNLFTQTEPSSNYTSSSSAISSSLTTSDKGIFQSVNDVLEKYVGLTGVTQANKGILCQMAYYQDNYSKFSTGSLNTFMDQIYQDNNQISTLSDTYNDARTRYYNQFSQLEEAITNLNSQSSVLQSYGLTSS